MHSAIKEQTMGRDEDFFLDIDLVTAGYLAMKGMPLPERYKKFSSEEIEQMKEKVSRYMGAE